MVGHTLAARSLNLHEGRFNWVFLLWYIVSSVLAILFLFYFNRLFASLVSYGIRAYTWHRYRVYIDVQALQFSLLAGRLFFKGLRYHGQNETVLIHDGYITWRYWLRHVQELDCKGSSGVSKAPAPSDNDSNAADGGSTNGRAEENGGNGTSRRLPCRVLMKSRGVEWFVYNRSPAYDAILQSMRIQEELDHANDSPLAQRPAERSKPDLTPKFCSSTDSSHKAGVLSSIEQKEEKEGQDDDTVADLDSKSILTDSSAQKSTSTLSAVPGLLNILPVRIECNKGAVVMGNRNTRSILTAKFDSAAGRIDARTSGAVDQYKQMFDFDFSHPVIEFKHNRDYTETQMSEGAKTLSRSSRAFEEKTRWFGQVDHRRRFRDIWISVRDFVPYHRGSVESLTHPRPKSGGAQKSMDDNAGVYGQNRWLGLTRYLDDDDDLIEQERWKAIEYGAFPTIVDSPEISMSIYWDVPGLVPCLGSTRNPPPGFETDINGNIPPDWGIVLKVRGGTINYGPWADRQRADLQAVFFPTLYKDAVPAAKLQSGQPRMSTVLKVVLEIEEQTTLRVPMREDSKDWKWRGRTFTSKAPDSKRKKAKGHAKSSKGKQVGQSAEVRPFGWLDIKVLPDSTVNFAMDLVARSSGYRNHVDLDLKGVEMSSSVNHGLLWRSQSQVISCDLSNPLGWNALRQWHIDINDSGLELFMLRDHMFLLTDLINDWTSGVLGDFHTFVPFEYSIGLRFADFKLYLNANDSNIINNPSDVDDNTFVVIWGQELKAHLVIPSKNYRPARNRVKFDIEATDGGFDLRTPPRNTQHTYLDSSDVATLRDLKIDGSYNYFTTTSPSLTDVLFLNVLGVALRFNLYGFLIRYLMKIKDNYFGDDIHFRTLEEYHSQINISEGQNVEDPGQHSRLSNDLDVILGIAAEDSCALLPAHLYSSERHVRLEIPAIVADLRITNYYMDLAITFSPIAISHTSLAELRQPNPDSYSSTQVFIDGFEVFGHRLFGLPPTEPTYVCNWDFDIGNVRGECSVDFFHCLSMALRCFTLSLDDAENALPPLNLPIIHDVTFLRARVRPVLVGLRIDQTAFLLSTQEAKFEYNDWAGSQFSDRLYVLVPDLTLSVVDAHGVSVDRRLPRSVVDTHAYVKLTLEMSKVKRKLDFNADRYLQQSHIALHDSRTRRVSWLVLEQDQYGALGALSRPTKSRPPAMTFPSMPEPVSTPADIAADETFQMSGTGLSTKASSRRSSFLSTASSRQRKVNRRDSGNRSFHRQQRQVRGPHYHFQGTEYHPTVESRVGEEADLPIGQRDSHTDSSVKLDNFARSGLAFTSPYKQPHFPLLAVQPDIGDVPILPKPLFSDGLVIDSNASNIPRPHVSDQGTEQSSFMVNLAQGVQTFCTPKALLVVTQLLARFQTTDAVTLLDSLQLDAMADVLNAEAKRTEGARISDVRIFVPWVGARLMSTNNSEPNDTRRNQRYDVILETLAVTARSSQSFSHIMPPSLDSQSSFHVVLDRMICAATEFRSNNTEDQAIISLSMREPVAWMWHGTSSAAELQFQTLEIESASRKVDYISSLVQQTLIMSEDFAQHFRTITEERQSRLRLLVLLLTVEGKDVPDPPFLTRASYVLRSASHHLRTSDSWKMMSRLRYIHRCLPAHAKDKIHAQCVHKLASCPADAGSRVIASFDHWHTWNLAHVRSSLLMQRVFGQTVTPPARDLQRPVPTKATLRAGAIQILVEPGPSQNEIAIEELSIGVALHQPSVSQGVSSTLQPLPLTRSTIQIHCAKVAVRLHWALLELIEDLIETVQATQISSRKYTSGSLEAAPRLATQNSCLHFAVSSDVNILTLATKNLKVISLCQGLRISIVSLQEGADSKISLFSALVDADAATSEIQGWSTNLTLYKLRRLRVFGSKSDTMGRTAKKPWKVVGSGEDVSFLVLANPLELIDVADSVLEHEVAHIKQWVKSIQLASSPLKLPVATQEPAGLLEAHVALSLDSYLISLTVLPSLTYQISGEGARTTFRSALRGRYDSVVHIDLNEHSHVFKSSMNDASNELSSLHMPPANARLGINLYPSQMSVVFNALVESVVFDASAVHAILTTVNRPEMASLGENIMEGASSIQNRYEQIFGMTQSRNEASSSEPILYNAYVTLSSLAVQANASDALSIAPAAQLQVKMGRIQLKTTNRDLGHGAPMRFPEAEVRFKGIQLKLLRFEIDGLRACGDVAIGAIMRSTSKPNDQAELVRAYQIQSKSLQINVYTDTASVVVAILANLQDTLRTVDLSHEVQTLRKLGHARLRRNAANLDTVREDERLDNTGRAALFSSMYSLEMTNICVAWKIGSSIPISPGREPEDLILSFAKIDLSTKKDNAARLLIQDFQLQMVPHSRSSTVRSQNSALLPEVVFNVAYVSTGQDRRLAFQAAGKSLDLRLTSQFILPASDLRRSIAFSIQQVRTATSDWSTSATTGGGRRKALFSDKKLASLLVDADFAGAVVFVQGRSLADARSLALNVLRGMRLPQHGRYNQFTPDNANNSSTTLRAPGIAFKVEYRNGGPDDQSLNAEMKIDASSNILYPTVVPLIMEISSSIKDVVGDSGEKEQASKPSLPPPRFLGDERLRGADPVAVFGNCKLNLGLRICRQEFSLSCQPIARVAATARFEDIYITLNTVQSNEHGRFFTVSAAFTRLHASVQHVYSRESTGNFEVDSIFVSLMNSKHVSATNGISAILNISPMKTQINAKQSQDFLLFREIWVPPEIRRSPSAAAPVPAESQAFIVQRYQHIAAASAFPWNATVSIAELGVQLDLGQSLGKSAFIITGFWISSKKTSDWEQNLCLGFNNMAINSTGRMSGFVELQNLNVRTSIHWPIAERAHNQTPLVQASLAFDDLRVKASFDYQTFLIADITIFEFLMYNVRDVQNVGRDRLVSVLDSDKVQVFCTTTSASQAIALYQAFQRLYQEKLAAYETSLRDIEKFLRRKSSINPLAMRATVKGQEETSAEIKISPLRLQTNVVVTLKSVNIGAFPSTFVDSQILKLEAFDASARFAVVLEHKKIHSTLGMTLGQLRVALASVTRASVPKTLGEVSMVDVVASATNSRGGTILKVPKLVASMETWQNPESAHINYKFKSSFQGKVDVGWNYSRISYIRGMWTSHARSLAQRLGKPLPQSAVHITGGPRLDREGENSRPGEGEQEKITAVVNVPQSKYQYTALQPPIIETPQLRDMGEATPPLEWIGLHRERLPNLTHQIVIVTLLEVAKKVDDAYSKILGSS